MVPSTNFKILSGKPKEISKVADSGKSITSSFCGDCGTTMWRHGDSFGGREGMRLIKAGILDDVNVINGIKPGAELFAPERISWVAALEGAGQLDSMPPA